MVCPWYVSAVAMFRDSARHLRTEERLGLEKPAILDLLTIGSITALLGIDTANRERALHGVCGIGCSSGTAR
jgi:hypothetical protein